MDKMERSVKINNKWFTVHQTSGSHVYTEIEYNKVTLEESTGGQDCWLFVEKMSDGQFEQFAKNKIKESINDARARIAEGDDLEQYREIAALALSAA